MSSSAFDTMVEIIATETSHRNDLVVKLSAVQVISTMLANFDEAAEKCIPLVTVMIGSLYRFAGECIELESQNKVLEAIPLLLMYIVGTGRDVSLEALTATVATLPSIWDGITVERIMLRRNVVSILTAVASSVEEDMVDSLLPVALPIIASSLDPQTSTENAFMVDEILLLWLTILRKAKSYSNTVGNMFHLVVSLLGADFEHLR